MHIYDYMSHGNVRKTASQSDEVMLKPFVLDPELVVEVFFHNTIHHQHVATSTTIILPRKKAECNIRPSFQKPKVVLNKLR